jgi:hypothetical protein
MESAALRRPDGWICFEAVHRLVPSAWLEHTPFAMFLVQVLRPQLVVELGTYSGASYCAFCQAIAALHLPARAYAIDTWKGDPHNGPYGEDILQDLRCYHDPRYGSFSILLPSTFDAALARFPDGSIDLLHIDGYHTYESVSHDFHTWLPKMSRRSIVLFHDTQMREHEFGVWRLWDELQTRYPAFEFHHGFGLGVLAVGTDLPPAAAAMFCQEAEAGLEFRAWFRQLGARVQVDLIALEASLNARRVAEQASDAYRQQLAQIQRTWTWRVGRVVTTPARLVRRLAA